MREKKYIFFHRCIADSTHKDFWFCFCFFPPMLKQFFISLGIQFLFTFDLDCWEALNVVAYILQFCFVCFTCPFFDDKSHYKLSSSQWWCSGLI